MGDLDEDLLEMLRKIHDLLVPISGCFEERYRQTLRQRVGTKLEELEALLTPTRRAVFLLLFDTRRLSQAEIAREASTTQPTVSRFVKALLERDLVEQTKSQTGGVVYQDKYELSRLVEVRDGQE